MPDHLGAFIMSSLAYSNSRCGWPVILSIKVLAGENPMAGVGVFPIPKDDEKAWAGRTTPVNLGSIEHAGREAKGRKSSFFYKKS